MSEDKTKSPNSATVDPAEHAYFNSLPDQWWNPQGKFWPLHSLNKLRSDTLKAVICQHFDRDPNCSNPLTGLSVLAEICAINRADLNYLRKTSQFKRS